MTITIQTLLSACRRLRGLLVLFTAVWLINCASSKADKQKSWTPPPDAQFVTEQGWLKPFIRPGGDPAIQLQTKDKVYWLVDTPNAKYTPTKDLTKDKIKWFFGEDHEYIVKGYASKPLTLEWFGSYPVLFGIEFNRIK